MGEVSQVSVDNWAQHLDWEWRRRGRVRAGCKDCTFMEEQKPLGEAGIKGSGKGTVGSHPKTSRRESGPVPRKRGTCGGAGVETSLQPLSGAR